MKRTVLVVVALLCIGCNEQVPQHSVSDTSEAYAGFIACMAEAGYSESDIETPTAPLEPSDGGGGHDHDDGETHEAEVDWNLELWRGRCINESGIGQSVVDDPAAVARRTEQAIALTACMRTRGWEQFPDPQPHPTDDGMVHSRIDIPEDGESREAFLNDFSSCSEDAGVPVVVGEP